MEDKSTENQGILICPTCQTKNPAEAKRCMECGRQLGAQCPICLTVNDPGASECSYCGATLDNLENILARQDMNKIQKEWLIASKREDAIFMKQERAKLDEEERQRQMQIAEQRAAARKEQEKILLIGGGALLLIAACVIIGAIVINMIR